MALGVWADVDILMTHARTTSNLYFIVAVNFCLVKKNTPAVA